MTVQIWGLMSNIAFAAYDSSFLNETTVATFVKAQACRCAKSHSNDPCRTFRSPPVRSVGTPTTTS